MCMCNVRSAIALSPLAGKSLEDIITSWQVELEKHSAAFVSQARVLAAWDGAVLANRHALLAVEAELRAVHAGQEALERQLCMIETHQKVCVRACPHAFMSTSTHVCRVCIAPLSRIVFMRCPGMRAS